MTIGDLNELTLDVAYRCEVIREKINKGEEEVRMSTEFADMFIYLVDGLVQFIKDCNIEVIKVGEGKE